MLVVQLYNRFLKDFQIKSTGICVKKSLYFLNAALLKQSFVLVQCKVDPHVDNLILSGYWIARMWDRFG